MKCIVFFKYVLNASVILAKKTLNFLCLPLCQGKVVRFPLRRLIFIHQLFLLGFTIIFFASQKTTYSGYPIIKLKSGNVFYQNVPLLLTDVFDVTRNDSKWVGVNIPDDTSGKYTVSGGKLVFNTKGWWVADVFNTSCSNEQNYGVSWEGMKILTKEVTGTIYVYVTFPYQYECSYNSYQDIYLSFVQSPVISISPSQLEVVPTALKREGYNIRNHYEPITFTINVTEGGKPVTKPTDVYIRVNSEDGDAGHTHATGKRPHGWLGDQIPKPKTKKVPKYKIGGSTETEATKKTIPQGESKIEIEYLPPEISGVETVTAEIPGSGAKPATATITVKIPDLKPPMLAHKYYRIGGNCVGHSSCFNLTSYAWNRMMRAGRLYTQKQRENEELKNYVSRIRELGYKFVFPRYMNITEGSLPWGGLFDINKGFKPPHGGHRWGDQLDIRTKDLVQDVTNPEGTLLGVCSTTDGNCTEANELAKAANRLLFWLMMESIEDAGGYIFSKENPPNHIHVTFSSGEAMAKLHERYPD